IHTRLTMLHTLVAAFLDEGDKQRYVELKGRIIKIASRRNNIVHGDWYIRNDEPDRIYLAEPFPITMAEAKPVPYTRRRFLDMLKDLTTLYNDLFAFQHHISDLNKDKPFPRSFLL